MAIWVSALRVRFEFKKKKFLSNLSQQGSGFMYSRSSERRLIGSQDFLWFSTGSAAKLGLH